ncbi:unnamed protein product [Linum trigynum]|uniref:F-box domain-containing protein n=1 Tax=Linum trigynum TaxID=586398 RepID=A0AAV2FIZ2_9ROSI
MARRFSPSSSFRARWFPDIDPPAPEQPPVARASSASPTHSSPNPSPRELGPPGTEFVLPLLPLPPIRASDRPKKADQPWRSLPSLHPELIAEILSWLPVHSLIRFRCVSKSFRTLISSPVFVKAHLRNMKALSRTKPNNVQRLIINKCKRWPRNVEVHSCSLNSLHNYHQTESEIYLVRPLYVPVLASTNPVFVGCCDGIICALGDKPDSFVLWNPSTRACITLPKYGSEPSMRLGSLNGIGFGYDRQLDDYKAVVLFKPKGSDDGTTYQTVAQVCALKSKLWRRIEDFPNVLCGRLQGKFAAGCLHWDALDGNVDLNHIIVSLDLATETHKQVMLPDFGEAIISWTLEVLDDCVCIMSDSNDSIGASSTLWMMKEHGVRDSWTKLFRVLYNDMLPRAWTPAVYISNSDVALFRAQDGLLIYDIEHNTVRLLISDASFCYQTHVYLETLVSPRIEI